ncbi:fimbrial protein [Kluyvera chengduensis]|uniref:fimbrial protein n=1 Tax=Kluyvera sp. 142359 TaxID=3375726 RepID=UPI0037709BCE
MISKLHTLLMLSCLVMIPAAQADYFSGVTPKTMGYDFNNWDVGIPATVGESSSYWTDPTSIGISTATSTTTGSYITLSVDGTYLGNNTYATSNSAIGIKFKTNVSYTTETGVGTETAPDFRYNLTDQLAVNAYTYLHVQYKLVRLQEKVPAGLITSAPIVTVFIHNPDGLGDPLTSFIAYSGAVSSQPKITACTIDAPTEIKLPTLYGNTLQNGAMHVTEIPTIKLTNCPGARTGINYRFSSTTHSAANGVIATQTGDGYAKNVYVQLQKDDGTAYNKINTSVGISNYDGSGDYVLPDFKVAYYIDDTETVTAGNVKAVLELTLGYN